MFYISFPDRENDLTKEENVSLYLLGDLIFKIENCDRHIRNFFALCKLNHKKILSLCSWKTTFKAIFS